MKKLFLTTISMFILGALAVNSQTLDEVLKNHFEAIGQDQLTKVESFEIIAKMSQMGMELPMKMMIKRPDKFRMEADIQGQKMIQAYDGSDGWMIAPWMSPEPVDLVGDQLKQAMEQNDIDGQLYNWKEKGNTAELIGKEDMEGTPVYNIKLTKKDGDIQNYYIDADSYILLKVKSKMMMQGNEMEVEQVMGNYKMINGIAMAMSIDVKVMGNTSQIAFETVNFNVPLDDSIFKRPAKQ